MFEIGNNNFVVFFNQVRERVGDEVKSFRSSFRKNNFEIIFGINEFLDLSSGKFHFFCRKLTQSVNSAVNIRVDFCIIFLPGI